MLDAEVWAYFYTALINKGHWVGAYIFKSRDGGVAFEPVYPRQVVVKSTVIIKLFVQFGITRNCAVTELKFD